MGTAVKIKLFEAAPNGYADHYVSRNLMAFAFMSKANEMIGPLVDCKGFMSNRVHGSINEMQYGSRYNWQPKYGKVDLTATRMLVVRNNVSTDEWTKECNHILALLNKVERELHLVRSEFSPVIGVPKEYGHGAVFTSSKRWMLAPPMISLYVWLLRNGTHYGPKMGYDDYESGTYIAKGIDFIIKNKYANVFGKDTKANWPSEADQDTIHQMGILEFSKGNASLIKQCWPHWMIIGPTPVNKKLKEKVA